MKKNNKQNELNATFTFYKMLKEYKIEIPIIQRDYAQGRIENTSIRITFLNRLKDTLMQKKTLNLDFIYGSIIKNIFYPLDGQQRLTTLYLLHWYAFLKSDLNDKAIKEVFLRFTYETRISSRRFCTTLINSGINLTDRKDNEKLSELIYNSNWFFISWKQDATISAMLNTIDDIDELFQNMEDLWTLLTESNLINFHLLILDNFGLSDDLYIKMNARGKQLTLLENLKAELQKKSQDNKWEDNKSIESFFSHKIDTTWTDFIWTTFRKEHSYTVDEQHMQLIKTLIMIQSVFSSADTPKENDKSTISDLNNKDTSHNLNLYIDNIDKETFDYIYTCYELYSKINKEQINLDIMIPLWSHNSQANSPLSDNKPAPSLLYTILLESSSYTQKVLFYAQTLYLEKCGDNFEISAFQDWMRVIRNIIARGNVTYNGKRPDIIRSPETFIGVIKLIKELSNGCEEIYTFLHTTPIKSGFSREQIKEEQIKSTIINTYPQHKELIHLIEDNELLRGKITFALECAGYSNDNDITKIDFILLKNIQRVFDKYFNKEQLEDFNLLRRAMLTIEFKEEYKFYNYYTSYWRAGGMPKKRLFIKFREIEYFIEQDNFKEYFKKLVLQLTNKNYRTIIEDFNKPQNMPNWQYRLIKEDNLLNNQCKSHWIAIPEDETFCYLLKTERPRELDGNDKIS